MTTGIRNQRESEMSWSAGEPGNVDVTADGNPSEEVREYVMSVRLPGKSREDYIDEANAAIAVLLAERTMLQMQRAGIEEAVRVALADLEPKTRGWDRDRGFDPLIRESKVMRIVRAALTHAKEGTG